MNGRMIYFSYERGDDGFLSSLSLDVLIIMFADEFVG